MPTNPSALEDYRAARRRGRRFASENPGDGGLLPVFVPPEATLSEFPLGVTEVPLSKIAGAFSAGRVSAFAGNYMPLLDENTEFAQKWMKVDSYHLTEGILESVKAYEYLGRVYVAEGSKRVSVLRYHGAYSVSADLIRLLPERDPDDPENAVFYEFYDHDRRAVIRHMWFSRPGRLPRLLELAARYASTRPDLSEDWLEHDFFRFRETYHALGLGGLPQTTGDAYLRFCEIFGFRRGDAELKAEIAAQFRRLPVYKRLSRSAKLNVCFALRGVPEHNSFAHKHDAGRYALQRRADAAVSAAHGLPPGDEAYPALRELLAGKPDLLFLTDPSWGVNAARLTLEFPDCLVLHCSPDAAPEPYRATYYGDTALPAFLGGVLAGCVTQTGVVAYLPPDAESGALPSDEAAFRRGAKLVNAHVRVQSDASGADTVWRPACPGVKSFTGLYAQLCRHDRRGRPTEVLAGAGWDWGAFYRKLIDDVLYGSPDSFTAAYAEQTLRLPAAAATELCTVPQALGEEPLELLRLFRHLAENTHELENYLNPQPITKGETV
jgi:hypothetical protein